MQNLRRLLCVFLLSSTSSVSSLAFQPRDVRDLFLVVAPASGKGAVVKKRFPYAELPRDAEATQVDPHPMTNPTKERAKWSGVSLRKLLRGLVRPDGKRLVVVSGASGYSSQFTEDVLAKHDVFIALEKNGALLAPAEGGPTLTFPLADKLLPDRFRNEPWWVWFVSAIIVGNPPPVVAVEGRKVFLPEWKTGVAITELPPCYPAGQRELVPPRENQKVSHVAVGALFGTAKGPVTLANYFAKELPLGPTTSEYQLAFAWNGKPIPPAFGGPVYAFRTGNPTECFPFIESAAAR